MGWDVGCEVKFPILWDLKGSMVGRKNGLASSAQKDQDREWSMMVVVVVMMVVVVLFFHDFSVNITFHKSFC